MTARLKCCVAFGVLLAVSAAMPTFAGGVEDNASAPNLVTFGPLARVNEGDHDFRQVVRISVPGSAEAVSVRVFDADTGGAHDEPKGGFDTQMRYSLFGDGAKDSLWRDGSGVAQEKVEGTPLGTMSFGNDAKADDRWTTLFTVDAGKGTAGEGGRRTFLLLVEGTAGNDGNLFDVAVSSSTDADKPIEGVQLTSLMPTFQVPRAGRLAELAFDVPSDAKKLVAENFDAAGGSVIFAGRFRSQALSPSGKSTWRRDEITLDPYEPGEQASLTAADGGEIPNDMTLFVGEEQQGADPVEHPLAIILPIKVAEPSRRPQIALTVTPQACGKVRFDASGSKDPENGPLTHSWRFLGEDGDVEGATVDHRFADYGTHAGRLESFNGSGLVGNGSARDFSFLVKAPPVASFEAPALVAEGAELILDASASTSPALPEGNHIAEYRWSLGDGSEIVQKQGDADFGRLAYRYTSHGVYTVTLTVIDSAANLCNSATATRTVTVNAPPVANAGGDRSMAAGEIAAFDAGLSSDPDGAIVSYLWDFGDGSRAEGPAIKHAYHKTGSYTVTLTVLDDSPFDNGKGIDTITVTVSDPANARPTAKAGDDRTIEVGQTIRFDGGASRDPDGEILRYAWDFGDGMGSDMPVVEHAYWQPGTYSVSLSVSGSSNAGNDNSVDSAVITVTPAKNKAPVAAFPKELSTTTFRPLRLDASKADDRDGSIIAFDWDFGDGTTGNGPALDHLYARPGTYDATLTLTDNGLPEPAKVSFPFRVLVANRPNLAPVAEAGKDATAFVGDDVTFDASSSSDPDGSIGAFRWDLGDGNHSSGLATHHVYQFPGTYTVSLAIDDDGPTDVQSASDKLTVTVKARDNQPPVAVAGKAIAAKTGEIVQFDGSGSSDPDGNILSYAWDFGDGGLSAEAKPRHAFHDPGTYRVKLTVADDGVTPAMGDTVVEVTVTGAAGSAP